MKSVVPPKSVIPPRLAPGEHLQEMLDRQPVVAGLPVLANVDFGHTQPQLTIPIGGSGFLETGSRNSLRFSTALTFSTALA